MAGYQSENGGAQYVSVQHNESESDRTSSAAGGVSKKTVGIFVTTLVAMCLIVAAFTSTHSAPAPSSGAAAAVPALDAKKQKKEAAAIVNPEDVNVCADPNYSSEVRVLRCFEPSRTSDCPTFWH